MEVEGAVAVGTVEVDGVRRGQDQRVAAGVDPDVRHQRCLEQAVQLGPVAAALLGEATQLRARGRRQVVGHRAARSRSILRPRKYAVPHSSAKIAPSPNINGTTNPSPIAAPWRAQPSA